MSSSIVDPLGAWSALSVGEPLAGGNRNDVRRAELHGEQVVAHRSGRAADSLAWELALLVDLDAAGFLVPVPLPADDGRLSVDGWTVRRWIDGREPASDDDWRRVADELRRVHRWGRRVAQRPTACTIAQLPARRRALHLDLDALPSDAAAAIERALGRYLEAQVSVIHGDPNGSNLRITPDGRVGLLDWDESRVNVPDLDLANLGVQVLLGHRRLIAEAAADAWEAVNGWVIEPDYARRRLDSLRRRDVATPYRPIGTEVLELRARTADDVEAHQIGEDAEFVRRLSGGVASPERSAEHIRHCARLHELGGVRTEWGIYERGEPTRLCGTIGINLADLQIGLDEVNISYGLFPTARGRGLATEALVAVAGFVDATFPNSEPVLKIEVDNQASAAVARRAGFVVTDRVLDDPARTLRLYRLNRFR